MKWWFKAKDGGPESKVTGYWLVEWKRVFSIVLLRFDSGSREIYHTHAFNACSWVLCGRVYEYHLSGLSKTFQLQFNVLKPSLLPVITLRTRLHKVFGIAPKTWILSFRGPWSSTWTEYDIYSDETTVLGHGRQVL